MDSLKLTKIMECKEMQPLVEKLVSLYDEIDKMGKIDKLKWQFDALLNGYSSTISEYIGHSLTLNLVGGVLQKAEITIPYQRMHSNRSRFRITIEEL